MEGPEYTRQGVGKEGKKKVRHKGKCLTRFVWSETTTNEVCVVHIRAKLMKREP